ncbi:MAG: DUF3846 domain-containing protein [Desulfitobacteriaceae bacterium]|nr:DUF3846 domain-containing protein [Desulfitobacteriaceae bacterium]
MRKERKIKVLRVQPNLSPDVIYLDNNLHALQAAVEGLIEIISLENGVCLLLNEEGKLIGFEPNRRLGSDILVGVFFVVGSDDSSGNLVSLSDEQISRYIKRFFLAEKITPEEVEDSIRIEFHTF